MREPHAVDAAIWVPRAERVGDHQVVEFAVERLAGLPGAGTMQCPGGAFGERNVEVAVTAPCGCLVAARRQFFLREVAQCCKHPVTGLPAVALDLQQRFVGQPRRDVQHVERVIGIERHPGGCGQREAACERRQPSQQLLLVGVEVVMAPVDRRAHRLVPRQHLVASAKQAKTIVEMIADRIEREKFHARRGELDRKRDPVQPPADIGDRGDRLRAGRDIRDHDTRTVDERIVIFRRRMIGNIRLNNPTSCERLLVRVIRHLQCRPLAPALGRPTFGHDAALQTYLACVQSTLLAYCRRELHTVNDWRGLYTTAGARGQD